MIDSPEQDLTRPRSQGGEVSQVSEAVCPRYWVPLPITLFLTLTYVTLVFDIYGPGVACHLQDAVRTALWRWRRGAERLSWVRLHLQIVEHFMCPPKRCYEISTRFAPILSTTLVLQKPCNVSHITQPASRGGGPFPDTFVTYLCTFVWPRSCKPSEFEEQEASDLGSLSSTSLPTSSHPPSGSLHPGKWGHHSYGCQHTALYEYAGNKAVVF